MPHSDYPTGDVGPGNPEHRAFLRERVAAYRRSQGLPHDPASDTVWVNRLITGQASEADVKRQIDLRASGNYQPFDPTPGGGGAGGGAAGGGGAAEEEEDDDEQTMDFHAAARRLFPWMPAALVEVYADIWAETGDPQQAIAEVRSHPLYEQHFPGNRRPDGTLRFDELTYLSVMDAYRTAVHDFGLNPEVFEDKGRFVDLLVGETSPEELRGRLVAVQEGIVGNTEQTREEFSRFYGIDMTDEAILASVIDPELRDDIVNRRIAVSQIGGEAARFGFRRSLSRADELASLGMGQGQARELFSTAAQRLPRLDVLASRFRDADPTFGIGEFEEAIAFGDVSQQRRIRRLESREESLFSRASSVRRGRSGALTGLDTR